MIYQTVHNQPSSQERDWADLARIWRVRANVQRDPKKIRFCEKRMMHYKALVEDLNTK